MFLVPQYNPQPNTRILSRVLQIDWIGALLSSSAFVAGIMAISFGGTLYSWESGQIIVLFVVSAIGFLFLFLQQSYAVYTTYDLRILPLHLFKVRDMALCFTCQG
jgi:hypothetical protein